MLNYLWTGVPSLPGKRQDRKPSFVDLYTTRLSSEVWKSLPRKEWDLIRCKSVSSKSIKHIDAKYQLNILMLRHLLLLFIWNWKCWLLSPRPFPMAAATFSKQLVSGQLVSHFYLGTRFSLEPATAAIKDGGGWGGGRALQSNLPVETEEQQV